MRIKQDFRDGIWYFRELVTFLKYALLISIFFSCVKSIIPKNEFHIIDTNARTTFVNFDKFSGKTNYINDK